MARVTDPDLLKSLRAESTALKGKLDDVNEKLRAAIAGKKPSAPHLDPIDGVERTIRPRRVLLIEDDEVALDLLRRSIERLGHVVETATNGVDGLVKVPTFRPEVAIIDLALPVMDGYAVARGVVAECGADVPLLVALTAQGSAAVKAAARAAGFAHHLLKPAPLHELMLLIQSSPKK